MSGDTLRPIGHQYALAMLGGGEERVRSLAQSAFRIVRHVAADQASEG